MKTALTMRAAVAAGAFALLPGAAFAAPPEPVTPQLIEAATEEIKKKYSQYFGIKRAGRL